MNAIHKHIADAGMLAKATGDKDTAHILFDSYDKGYTHRLRNVCQREYERETSHRDHVEALGL